MVLEEDAALSATLKVFRVVSSLFTSFPVSLFPALPSSCVSSMIRLLIYFVLFCLCSCCFLSRRTKSFPPPRWLRCTPRPPPPRTRRCSWCPRAATTTRGSGRTGVPPLSAPLPRDIRRSHSSGCADSARSALYCAPRLTLYRREFRFFNFSSSACMHQLSRLLTSVMHALTL